MIVFLKGIFVSKSPAQVCMEVNGIGYEVHISLHTYSGISHMDQGLLLTHLQVKEDGFTLFGFHTEEERALFLQLISVNGIGASTARMMLSSMKPEEIRRAIITEDEKQLERIKGIGAKSAKRLIVELKDKLMKAAPPGTVHLPMGNNSEIDALNALVSLGIARQAAQNAIQKALKTDETLSLEDLIKQALKNI